MKNKWTEIEIEKLYKYYPTSSRKELEQLFPNKNYQQIKDKTRSLGIKHNNANKNWTEEQVKFILENYRFYSTDYMSLTIYKSVDAINNKAKRLGVDRKYNSKWTEEEQAILISNMEKTLEELLILIKTKSLKDIKKKLEIYKKNTKEQQNKKSKTNDFKKFWSLENDKFLIENHQKMSNDELAEIMGITKNWILRRVNMLEISTTRKWEQYEDKYLIENASNLSLQELADKLNRSKTAIKTRASRLNIYTKWWNRKDDEFLELNRNVLTISEIAEALNRSYSSVQHRMSKLKLTKAIKKYKGFSFESSQELDVFKFIEKNFTPTIEKNTVKYNSEKYNENYIPDFIIREIFGKKLKKPLIIEFFGLYLEGDNFKKYRERTYRKVDYFTNNEDIFFIALYPEDIKDKFKGISKKLMSFFYIKNLEKG